MGPVFSLVLDTDIKEDLALVYPELYKVGLFLTCPQARV